MTDFLREHGTEAVNMLFTEFNMDDALDVRYEEGQKEGMRKGLEQGRQEGLKQGQNFILRLINAMTADGRADELLRLQIDPALIPCFLLHSLRQMPDLI